MVKAFHFLLEQFVNRCGVHCANRDMSSVSLQPTMVVTGQCNCANDKIKRHTLAHPIVCCAISSGCSLALVCDVASTILAFCFVSVSRDKITFTALRRHSILWLILSFQFCLSHFPTNTKLENEFGKMQMGKKYGMIVSSLQLDELNVCS